MNENNLDKMIEKSKKYYKEKSDQLQKRSDRKLRIKIKKRFTVKKTRSNSDIAKIGE